jgi:hypothetical protein
MKHKIVSALKRSSTHWRFSALCAHLWTYRITAVTTETHRVIANATECSTVFLNCCHCVDSIHFSLYALCLSDISCIIVVSFSEFWPISEYFSDTYLRHYVTIGHYVASASPMKLIFTTLPLLLSFSWPFIFYHSINLRHFIDSGLFTIIYSYMSLRCLTYSIFPSLLFISTVILSLSHSCALIVITDSQSPAVSLAEFLPVCVEIAFLVPTSPGRARTQASTWFIFHPQGAVDR